MLLKKILLLITALTLTVDAEDEVLSNYASEFHVAFLRQVESSNHIEMIVLTKSSSPVQFTISSSGYSYTGTTTANAATFVTIPSSLQVRESSYIYRHLGLHVTSSPSQPIAVIMVGYTDAPRSTYLALPCHDQPTDEYVYYGISHETNVDNYYGQILLVGCRDNTTVTITPTQNIQLPQNVQQRDSNMFNIGAGNSYKVTLHALQTLLIAAEFVDLSGTKIVSNYPLTVIGGHQCATVPVSYSYCDPIATQVPPTINWGTQFILAPLQNRSNGQRFKIIASKNNVHVNITCQQTSKTIILPSSGDVLSQDNDHNTFCYIQCSQLCYIAEFAFSHARVTDYGDPLLMTVPHIRQYPHSVTFTTLPEMPTNFYSIAVPADTYFNDTVIINGLLTTLNWTSIYNSNGTISGYGYTTSANGNYTISHSNPNGKIYVSVYGFHSRGGYGYIAGMLLKTQLISFNASMYVINEGDGCVDIYIVRSYNIEENITVFITCEHTVMKTEATGNEDYLSINRTVTFYSGQTIKAVSITIFDDDIVEETEFFTVKIITLYNNVLHNLSNIDETIVTIKDNDYIHIGFKQELIKSMSTFDKGINLEIVHYSGILQPGLTISLTLQLEGPQGVPCHVNVVQFGDITSTHTVIFNVSRLFLALIQTTKNFNITGRLAMDYSSSVHTILNPAEVNINYNPNILIPFSTSSLTVYTAITTTFIPTPTICTEAVGSSYITFVVGGVMAVIVIIVIIIFTTVLIISYFYIKYKRKELTTNSHCSENTLTNPIYQESIPANYINLSKSPKTNSMNIVTEETYSKLSYPFDMTAVPQQPESLHQMEASTMNLTTPNYHIR